MERQPSGWRFLFNLAATHLPDAQRN